MQLLQISEPIIAMKSVMGACVQRAGSIAKDLENIQFGVVIYVERQHPEGRPQALSRREFHSDLEVAISLREGLQRGQQARYKWQVIWVGTWRRSRGGN